MMASTTSPRSSAFIDGYQVRAGLRIPWDSNHERLSFSFFTVCDQATPAAWHGEVVLRPVASVTRCFDPSSLLIAPPLRPRGPLHATRRGDPAIARTQGVLNARFRS